MDNGERVAVDAGGNAYVMGFSSSLDFPTTAGAFDRTNNGGFDVTLTKVNPSGSGLVYPTYLGGQGSDSGGGLVVNDAGEAFGAATPDPWISRRLPSTAYAAGRERQLRDEVQRRRFGARLLRRVWRDRQ